MASPSHTWQRSRSPPQLRLEVVSLGHHLHDVRLDDPADAEAQLQAPPDARPACFRSLLHEAAFVFFSTMTAASLLVLQRATVIVTATFKAALSMTTAEVTWTVASSGLAAGAFLLPFAFFSEECSYVSRKTLLLGSLALYALVVGLTALAPNGIYLAIMSALAGVACCAHICTTVGIMSSAYPAASRRKNVVFSVFLCGGNAVGAIFAGVLAGTVDNHFGWRASFVLLACVFGAVALLGAFVVPNVPRPHELPGSVEDDSLRGAGDSSLKRPGVGEIDWTGTLLLVSGIALVTVAVTIAPQVPLGWKAPYLLLMIIVGALSLICWMVWENFTLNPMIPPIFWRSRNLALVILLTILSAMGYFSSLFWVSFFLQTVQRLTPFHVSLRLFAQPATGILLSPLAGFAMDKVDNTVILAAAALFQAGSSVLLFFLGRDSSYFAFVFPALVLSTLSMDWSLSISGQYILSAMPQKHQTAGAAVLQTMSRLAIPAGLAITTAVWSSFDQVADEDDSGAQLPFTKMFIATMAFAAASILVVPFIRIGKLGCPSQRSSIVYAPDGHTPNGDGAAMSEKSIASRRNGIWDGAAQIGSRTSSLVAGWRGRSAVFGRRNTPLPTPPRRNGPGPSHGHGSPPATSSFRLPPPPTLPALSLGNSTASSRASSSSSRRASTPAVIAERVIWLVCEDCGSRRRVAEPVGDPGSYFFHDDDGDDVDDGVNAGKDCRLDGRDKSESSLGTMVRRFPLARGHGEFL